jgi:signal transduction histidine kinase
MRERAEAIGGRLIIRTKAGAGTQLEIAVPMRATALS